MRLEGRKGQFPVGMSVLAVDDDPVCLKVLEALLLRCRYYVTTTSQAITALKLLRENKDMFDLVISDVHMPDMDGFRLLEHVGLEMDLPVIMLSVNGETKTVMKGITHGACDYLLKPVRIEELRNIWQHVVRRKFSNHEWNGLDVYEEINKPPSVDSDHGQASTKGSTDQSASLSKKRKEQHNDEEDEGEESDAQENGEPSAPKKARVVWSVELHQKFVAAGNKLGIDKAVPKRILELMNVEKLTRENVASHLQKYRLYLKRLSSVASQQASIVAAVGGRDTSFLHMSVFEGFQSYQAVTPPATLPYFNPHGSLGRTNATISGFQHLAPSMAIQSSTSISTISQCVAETNRFQLARLPEKQQGSLTQGLSTFLGQGHLQQKWIHGEANNLPTVFSASGVTNYMCGALQSVPNSTLLTQELLECTQAKGGTQRSTRMPSVSSEHFEGAVRVSSNLLEQTGIFSGSELACPYNGLMVAKDSRSGVSSFGSTILLPPENEEHSKYSNCRDLNSSRQKTGESKPDHVLDSKLIWGSFLDSRLLNDMRVHNSPSSQGLNNCSIYHNAGACATRQSNASTSVPAPRTKIDMHASKDNLKTKNVYDLCISKMQGGISSSSCNLDGLLNSIINTEKDDVSLIDNELGCDFYPLGACM